MTLHTDTRVGTPALAGEPPIPSLPTALIAAAYLAGSVFLDWISFIEPFASFGITPWSPDTGLAFVLILFYGRRMIPLLFLGPLLSQLIQHHPPLPLPVELLHAAIIGGGYSCALIVLTMPAVRFDPALSSMRDLFILMVVAAVSSALVAAGYVAVAVGAELLEVHDFGAAAFRYWVGDMIGIMVIVPFALIFFRRRSRLRLTPELVCQCGAILAALAFIFIYPKEQQLQLFYILFLPVTWMAVHSGTEGATAGILLTQIGLILGVTLFPEKNVDVTALQVLMLVLAVSGLIAGELVTERQRSESALALHRGALARLARLGSMSEFAAAVAHELNQPLMAAGTYTRLVQDAIASGETKTEMIAEPAKKAVAQVERAAEVVRRLRALIRLDRGGRSACDVERIVRETLDVCRPDLDRVHGVVELSLSNDLPAVNVDILQIQQVLLNLIRNSVEAIREAGIEHGEISIAAARNKEFVQIHVSDSGPGFPKTVLDNPFLPFSSTKAEGLGFGLSLCKSIVESHGGRLWLDRGAGGAHVFFTLPVVNASSHE